MIRSGTMPMSDNGKEALLTEHDRRTRRPRITIHCHLSLPSFKGQDGVVVCIVLVGLLPTPITEVLDH
jgi:hypothetical protein